MAPLLHRAAITSAVKLNIGVVGHSQLAAEFFITQHQTRVVFS